MQQLLKIIPFLLTLILSAACKGDRQADELTAKAQLLIDTQPDSALIILDEIREKKGTWNKSQQMRYELVYAQAQNKAFVNFTTDSIVLLVADYYKHHGSSNDRMMAYYMTGCAYRDMGDAPSALKYMNLAVDAVDENDKDCDLKTLMHIHSQMGGLYQDVGAFKNEHIVDSHAERLAWQIGDTVSALHLMWTRASGLYVSNTESEAFAILDSIEAITCTYSLPEAPILLYPMRTYTSIAKKDIIGTANLLNEYEQKTGMTPNTPDNEIIDIAHLIRKGNYYVMSEKADSAVPLLCRSIRIVGQRELGELEKYRLTQEAYQGLMDAYSDMHIPDSVLKYAKLYTMTGDSLARKNTMEQLLRMQSLYNYTKIQEKLFNIKQRTYLLQISFLILFVLFATFAYFVRQSYKSRLNKERNRLTIANKEYHLLKRQMENSVEELKILRTDSERFHKEKENYIHKLQKSLSLYETNSMNVEQWNTERSILECNIAKHLHTLSAQGKKATHNELDNLKSIAKNGFPRLYNIITDKQKALTNQEIIICILVRFQFIPSEIAVLTGHSSQRITNIRSKINKKLFNKEGAKTLAAHLIALK